jgi:hypothetical protein
MEMTAFEGVMARLSSPAQIREEMLKEAREASTKFFQEKLGGQDQYACGFAWTTIYPKNKGNTKAGKAERKIIAELGFEKDWTGKAYQIWNPGQYHGQNIDAKEAGAVAAANVLKKYGFSAYAGSRLD